MIKSDYIKCFVILLAMFFAACTSRLKNTMPGNNHYNNEPDSLPSWWYIDTVSLHITITFIVLTGNHQINYI